MDAGRGETPPSNKEMPRPGTRAVGGLHAVVRKLERFCASQNNPETLPDPTELATRLGCSRLAATSAIRILLNRGLLVKSRRGLTPASPEPRPSPQRWEAFADSIEKDILAGLRKAGEHLPKKSYFATIHHLSNTTILKAFRHCAQRGLLHKEGRSWVVGRRAGGRSSGGQPPVVLILENRIGRLHSLSTIRTQRFTLTFQEEARKCGIQLAFGLTEQWAAPEGTIPRGKGEIMGLVSRLGYRYRGALVVATRDEFEEMADYVTLLSSVGQPVVWLDVHDAGVSQSIRSKQFRRAHFSENAALFAALRHLTERGHRTIGFSYNPRVDWQHCRYRAMLAIVQRKRLPLKIVSHPRPKSIWERMAEKSVERNVDRLLTEGAPILAQNLSWLVHHVEGFLDSVVHLARLHKTEGEIGLIRCSEYLSRRCHRGEDRAAVFSRTLVVAESPLLVPFVSNPSVTALIAPNDHHARTIYFWLRRAGVDIPREISLLSFDNHEQFLDIPVSTVDFGFGYLGYAALHAILADVPVRANKKGDIPSQPHIVDRGSVSLARTGPIEIDFGGVVW